MSREGKLAKNTLILSIGSFLPKLAAFITLPILTGYLTKEEYGMFDQVTVLVSLLLPAATLEIQIAAFRFLIDVRKNIEEIKNIVTNIFVFIIPTSIVTLAVLYFIMYTQPVIVRLFICLYLLADIVVNCARQVCRGLDRTVEYTVSAIISAAGKIILVAACIYWLNLGLLGAVISMFGASTISLVYLILKVRLYRYIDPKCINGKKTVEMLKYSWPMVPNSLSAWVMRASDRMVVIAFMGLEANAVYAVANKLPSLLDLAQRTFTMSWQENASIVSKDDDAGEYYSSMFRTILDMLTGFFCLLIPLTPLLFKLLIRGSYDEAYNHIPILFVAMFFLGLSTYIGGIFIAYKRTKSIGLTTVAAAVINLLTDIGTIKFIGLYAASGSTLVSYVFLFVFRLITVQKIIRVRFSKSHMLVTFLLIGVSCALYYCRSLPADVVNLLFGTAVFVALNRPFIKAVYKKAMKIVRKRSPQT